MSSPQPPKKPQTLLGQLTQAVQTIQAQVDFSKLALKPNARVPELWVQEAGATNAQMYPLLGDRYMIGRNASRFLSLRMKNQLMVFIEVSVGLILWNCVTVMF